MKTIILAASLLIASTSFAGGNHYHPKQVVKCSSECTQAEIQGAIPAGLDDLIKWGKIDASWKSAKVESVAKKDFKKGPEWVATLVNEKTNEKRYVFFTLKGYVNGANSTGN
ncbi:MAG: DUF6488 family protein [Pseudobdellovibrionaceae bacterium]